MKVQSLRLYHFCVVGYLPRSTETLVFWRNTKVNRITHIYCKQNTIEYLSLGPVLDLHFQKVTVLLKLVVQWGIPSRVQRLTYNVKGKKHQLHSTLKKLVRSSNFFTFVTSCTSGIVPMTLYLLPLVETVYYIVDVDNIHVPRDGRHCRCCLMFQQKKKPNSDVSGNSFQLAEDL